MVNKIYVGGISSATTEKKLLDHFSKIGEVARVVIVKGINPAKHSGYGYVIMMSEKDMKTAIVKLNNSLLDNNKIRVVPAHFMDQERKQYYYRRY